MSERVRSWLIPAILLAFAVVAVAAGASLGASGRFDRPDNLLFEADCTRVIENTTTLRGPQERARIHPLHVLVAAPPGTALSWLIGSKETATVMLTALAAALVLLNVARVLRQQFKLGTADCVLFVLLAGASASHVTFAMVPDTHVLSALGLSGMAAALTPERLARLRAQPLDPIAWLRAGGYVSLAWAVFAVGMLGTNIAVVPVLVFLQQPPSRSFWRRAAFSAICSAGVLALVLGLHFGQRAVLPPVPAQATTSSESSRARAEGERAELAHRPDPPAAASSEASATGNAPQGRIERLTRYARETWMHNSRWITPLDKIHVRAAQVLNAVFVTTFFAPRFLLYERSWSDTLGASFEPWAFDHRSFAVIGLIAWLSALAWLVFLSRSKARPDGAAHSPLLQFLASVIAFYALLVGLYGDELFLYSPNWMFAVVLGAAALFARALGGPAGRHVRPLRVLLWVASVCLLLNSASHTRDLLRHFL